MDLFLGKYVPISSGHSKFEKINYYNPKKQYLGITDALDIEIKQFFPATVDDYKYKTIKQL